MIDKISEIWKMIPEWLRAYSHEAGWALITLFLGTIWLSRKRLVNSIACYTFLRKKRVRLSASGLIRIRIDDKYLLVRGNRIKTQFQPVGGVFKYYADGKAELDKLGFQTDSAIKVDKVSREDLRINVLGKKFPALLQWFDSRKGRECESWREFVEELINPGILSSAIFPHAKLPYLRRKETFIHWSVLLIWEILVADIFELVPTPEQEAELRRVMKVASKNYIWLTADQIRRRGIELGQDSEYSVSPTAFWIL